MADESKHWVDGNNSLANITYCIVFGSFSLRFLVTQIQVLCQCRYPRQKLFPLAAFSEGGATALRLLSPKYIETNYRLQIALFNSMC